MRETFPTIINVVANDKTSCRFKTPRGEHNKQT